MCVTHISHSSFDILDISLNILSLTHQFLLQVEITPSLLTRIEPSKHLQFLKSMPHIFLTFIEFFNFHLIVRRGMNSTFLHCFLSFCQHLEAIVSYINFFIHITLNLRIYFHIFIFSTEPHERDILFCFCFFMVSSWTHRRF